MYLIVNTTQNILTISDLKVQLEKHQMVDLDKWSKLPMRPEDSKDLEFCRRNGSIKIMKNDRQTPAILPQEIKETSQINEEKIASSLIGPLQEFIKSEMAKQAPSDNSQILNAIGQLQSMIGKNSNQNNQVIEVDVDEDKMVEMHAKTMNKITKNISGELSHNSENKEDSSISNNVDELEGLL